MRSPSGLCSETNKQAFKLTTKAEKFKESLSFPFQKNNNNNREKGFAIMSYYLNCLDRRLVELLEHGPYALVLEQVVARPQLCRVIITSIAAATAAGHGGQCRSSSRGGRRDHEHQQEEQGNKVEATAVRC
jgi:hypothetical protein